MNERKETLIFLIPRNGSPAACQLAVEDATGRERLSDALAAKLVEILKNGDGIRDDYRLHPTTLELCFQSNGDRVKDLYIRRKTEVGTRVACTEGAGRIRAQQVERRILRRGFPLSWALHVEFPALATGTSGTAQIAALATLRRPLYDGEDIEAAEREHPPIQAFLKQWGGFVDRAERGFVMVRAVGTDRIYDLVRR